MKLSAARTVEMHTKLNVTAKRNFRACIISVTIVAGSAETEDHEDTTPSKWPVSGPISETGTYPILGY
jgi:hypothetical protein